MPKTYLLKPPASEPGFIDRMQRAAAGEGLEFAAFVREALEARAAKGTPNEALELDVGVAPQAAGSRGLISPAGGDSSVKAERREPCIHRIPPASFCKVCDQ